MHWATGVCPAPHMDVVEDHVHPLRETMVPDGPFQLGHTSCSGMVKAAQQEDLGVNMVPNQQISDLRSICEMCWTSSGGRKLQKEQETNN